MFKLKIYLLTFFFSLASLSTFAVTGNDDELTFAEVTLDDMPVLADSVVSDSDLDAWLEQFAEERNSASSDKNRGATSNKNKKIIKHQNKSLQEDSVARASAMAKLDSLKLVAEKKRNVPLSAPRFSSIPYDELIPEEDSLIIHHESIMDSHYNPLFLDWVFGGARGIESSLSQDDSTVVNLRREAVGYIRATATDLFTYHFSEMPDFKDIKADKKNKFDSKTLKLNVKSNLPNKINIDLPKASPWSYGAKFQVQTSQSYISPNWYNGGESNLSGFAYAMGYCNFNNKKNVQWDNKAEWKIGVNSAGTDTLRKFRVNEDYLKAQSKLGIKAFNKFYYTAEVNFQAQLFNTYKANTHIRTSGFLSPIRTNVSLGMDYKYKKMVSVFLSPVSYKLIFVNDTSYKNGVLPSENIAHQVGITNGTRVLNQLGGLVRVNFKYDFIDAIGMEVKFSLFANYIGDTKGVEVDCEVIGNFKVNRFFSAMISVNPRYDSTVVLPNGEKPKLQFKELLTLGFSYSL